MIIEKANGITPKPRSLQSDILDINEIFQQLGALVHDQGEVVGEFNQ